MPLLNFKRQSAPKISNLVKYKSVSQIEAEKE